MSHYTQCYVSTYVYNYGITKNLTCPTPSAVTYSKYSESEMLATHRHMHTQSLQNSVGMQRNCWIGFRVCVVCKNVAVLHTYNAWSSLQTAAHLIGAMYLYVSAWWGVCGIHWGPAPWPPPWDRCKSSPRTCIHGRTPTAAPHQDTPAGKQQQHRTTYIQSCVYTVVQVQWISWSEMLHYCLQCQEYSVTSL